MEAVLPLLINADQTGFIKGRYIGENVRLISDIISYTAAKNLPGLAVFLDFEKEFDSFLRFLTNLILVLTSKTGYKLFIATQLAVSQTMVMPLISSSWSEASGRVAHYQAHSSSLVLKFLHLRLKENPNI